VKPSALAAMETVVPPVAGPEDGVITAPADAGADDESASAAASPTVTPTAATMPKTRELECRDIGTRGLSGSA
jgi:hypothetical protein